MTRHRTGIVLQARTASTRLPGKALETIGPYSLVEHCLRRLVAAGVARVVLATTTDADDDRIAEVARGIGVGIFRGSRNDVLERYVAAAEAFGFDLVVRATGDNPAVDVQAPGRVLSAIRSTGADYACERGLPLGAGVEAVTAAALRRAAACATEADDREHVTMWIKRNGDQFRLVESPVPAPLDRPDLRFTVDTRDDLAYMRSLFARTGRDEPSLRALIEAAGRRMQREVA